MRTKISASVLILIISLSFCALPAAAQSAGDILEKMIEAQGGRKALEAVKDTTMTGTMTLAQQPGLVLAVTMYLKEPNKFRMDMKAMGMNFTQAFDGQTGWSITSQTASPQAMDEAQTKDMRHQAVGNDAYLNPAKVGIEYVFKGREKVDGRDCLVLDQAFKDGHKNTLYLDSVTYLTLKSKSVALDAASGSEIPTESILSDYRKVGETMVAFSIVIYQNGVEAMKMTLSEVVYNSGLEDALFLMK